MAAIFVAVIVFLHAVDGALILDDAGLLTSARVEDRWIEVPQAGSLFADSGTFNVSAVISAVQAMAGNAGGQAAAGISGAADAAMLQIQPLWRPQRAPTAASSGGPVKMQGGLLQEADVPDQDKSAAESGNRYFTEDMAKNFPEEEVVALAIRKMQSLESQPSAAKECSESAVVAHPTSEHLHDAVPASTSQPLVLPSLFEHADLAQQMLMLEAAKKMVAREVATAVKGKQLRLDGKAQSAELFADALALRPKLDEGDGAGRQEVDADSKVLAAEAIKSSAAEKVAFSAAELMDAEKAVQMRQSLKKEADAAMAEAEARLKKVKADVVTATQEEVATSNILAKARQTVIMKQGMCSGWSPSSGSMQGKGGSCGAWGGTLDWCYVKKNYNGLNKEFLKPAADAGAQGKFYVPCRKAADLMTPGDSLTNGLNAASSMSMQGSLPTDALFQLLHQNLIQRETLPADTLLAEQTALSLRPFGAHVGTPVGPGLRAAAAPARAGLLAEEVDDDVELQASRQFLSMVNDIHKAAGARARQEVEQAAGKELAELQATQI